MSEVTLPASLSEAWGLELSPAVEVQTQVWNIRDTYFLKAYPEEEEGKRAALLLEQLKAQGLPVAPVVKTVQGLSYVQTPEGTLYLLTRALPGRAIEDPFALPGLFFKMGRAIARLHTAFRLVEEQLPLRDNCLLSELQGWIREELDREGWHLVDPSAFSFTAERLALYAPHLPRQLIHRDVHLGNFLFDGDCFSGYIDFDLSQRNFRIFDLCYFLTGLLTPEEGVTPRWRRAVSEALQGYESLSVLSAEEKQAIPHSMAAIELLFAAWYSAQGKSAEAQNAAALYDRLYRLSRQEGGFSY